MSHSCCCGRHQLSSTHTAKATQHVAAAAGTEHVAPLPAAAAVAAAVGAAGTRRHHERGCVAHGAITEAHEGRIHAAVLV